MSSCLDCHRMRGVAKGGKETAWEEQILHGFKIGFGQSEFFELSHDVRLKLWLMSYRTLVETEPHLHHEIARLFTYDLFWTHALGCFQ